MVNRTCYVCDGENYICIHVCDVAVVSRDRMFLNSDYVMD